MTPRAEGWDIIFVGSGINALAFAAAMAHRHPQKRCLVLEKHHIPGGYATTFMRRGTRFDCSLHKLTGIGQGGHLGRVLADLGVLDDLVLSWPEHFFRAHFRGEEIALSNRYEAFKYQLVSRFPAEERGLAEFFRDVEIHGRNFYYYHEILKGTERADPEALRYARRRLRSLSVADALTERVVDPLLVAILAAPCMYAGGYPEDLGYLYYLHLWYGMLVCGNAFPQGGSQAISNRLVERIRSAGGEVRLRNEVKQILVDGDQRAYGVRTGDGSIHLGKHIYVNAAPHVAVERLLPRSRAVEEFASRLPKLKPSYSTTTLYLETDVPPEELGLPGGEMMLLPDFLISTSHGAATRGEATAEAAFWRCSTMEVTNYHGLDPSGGKVVCLNVLDSMDHWPARRTAEYKAKKARAGQILLRRLLGVYPDLDGHVAHTEVASPRTYERYTSNHRGSGYGAMMGHSHKTDSLRAAFPIQSLDFLSAWVVGPGYEAAFAYADLLARNHRSA